MEESDALKGEFEFINVGRSKAFFVSHLDGEDSLFKAVKPYLMSNDLSYSYDPETKTGEVFAGFHTVGNFSRTACQHSFGRPVDPSKCADCAGAP